MRNNLDSSYHLLLSFYKGEYEPVRLLLLLDEKSDNPSNPLHISRYQSATKAPQFTLAVPSNSSYDSACDRVLTCPLKFVAK